MLSNRKRQTNKSLTLNNPMINKIKKSSKNTIDFLNVSGANIGTITTNTIDISQNINAREGSISNILFYHDSDLDYSYIQNLSNNLIIKSNDNTDSIRISDIGDIFIENNLYITDNLNTTNGIFKGDVEAININLLGDITSSNAYFTNDLITNGNLISKTAHILSDVKIDGCLNIKDIITDNITLCKNLKTNSVETPQINSDDDINIISGVNKSINVPNIRYSVDLNNSPIIDPINIKATKIFIITKNIILRADNTCSGIEIIFYNKNTAGNIIIRDTQTIIYTLFACCAVKLMYIDVINKWIKI